jgi:hypothetical protein
VRNSALGSEAPSVRSSLSTPVVTVEVLRPSEIVVDPATDAVSITPDKGRHRGSANLLVRQRGGIHDDDRVAVDVEASRPAISMRMV